MTKGEAIKQVETHIQTLEECEEGMGRKPYTLIEALKRVLREAKGNK